MKLTLAFVAGLLACAFIARATDLWTLKRSLDYALTHNSDARLAQQRIAAAQAGLEQANSAFWPRLQVQSGYTRTDNPMLAFGSILNQRSHSSSLNFNDVPTWIISTLGASLLFHFTTAEEMSRVGSPRRRTPRPRNKRVPL